jgi:hypothetical protein
VSAVRLWGARVLAGIGAVFLLLLALGVVLDPEF